MAAPAVNDPRTRPLPKRIKRRIEVFLARWVGPLVVRMLARTWRVELIGVEHREAATHDGKRPVFSFWHETVLVAMGSHLGYGIRVMVSRHHDGDVVANLVKSMGFQALRGSSSRGGAAALREMLREAQEPDGYAITPDGPRGPSYSIAPGVLHLAATVRRPLVAAGFAASRCWRVNSWDRMIIPKPFAKVVVAYGEGMELPRALIKDEEMLERCTVDLAEAMERARRQAEAAL